jgi:hypothetical protein
MCATFVLSVNAQQVLVDGFEDGFGLWDFQNEELGATIGDSLAAAYNGLKGIEIIPGSDKQATAHLQYNFGVKPKHIYLSFWVNFKTFGQVLGGSPTGWRTEGVRIVSDAVLAADPFRLSPWVWSYQQLTGANDSVSIGFTSKQDTGVGKVHVALTVIDTFATNTWHHVEGLLKNTAVNGRVVVKHDGIVKIDSAGAMFDSTAADSVWFGFGITIPLPIAIIDSGSIYYDDVVIDTSTGDPPEGWPYQKARVRQNYGGASAGDVW